MGGRREGGEGAGKRRERVVKREKRATGTPATNKLKPTSIHNILFFKGKKKQKTKHLSDVKLKQGIYSSLTKEKKKKKEISTFSKAIAEEAKKAASMLTA